MEVNDYVINIASSIVAVEYMHHGFGKKYCGTKRRLLFALFCVVYFLVVTVLNQLYMFEGILGFLYGTVLISYGFAALKGKWHEFLIAGVMCVFIAMVSTYCIFGVLGLVSGKSLETILPLVGEKLLYASIVALEVKFSMGRIAMTLFRRKNVFHKSEKWIVAGVFVLTTMLVMGIFCLEIGEMTDGRRNLLTIGILVDEIFVMVFLVELYHKLGVSQRRELECRYQLAQEEEKRERMKELYRVSREVNHWRHDMLGELGTLHRLSKNGKYDEVEAYLEKIYGNLSDFPELPQPTGNEGLDAALMKTIPKCREEGIAFHYVVLGNPSSMDSMEMGKLADNLLNNAVEACMKVERDREIEFRVQMWNGKMIIHLKNSIAQSLMEHNSDFHTQKPDTEHHGFGMESINQIVERNKGSYEYWEEAGRFCQEVRLYI